MSVVEAVDMDDVLVYWPVTRSGNAVIRASSPAATVDATNPVVTDIAGAVLEPLLTMGAVPVTLVIAVDHD